MATELSEHVEDNRRELAASGAVSANRAEVEAAITVALRFPRDEDDAYGKLINACSRPSFQQVAIYRYPRGGTDIEGPSVNLAREFARLWGNVRYGFEVVSEDEETCHVRGFAWDMQTNMKVTQDASFKVLIYRKKGGWQKPDERDKRELVNKHGSICERNCLLKVLPRDMVEDAMAKIDRNVREGIKNDLEASRKKIVGAFGELNITAKQIEEYLGHALSEVSEDEVLGLRKIYTSIRDGNSRWSEYVEPNQSTEKRANNSVSMDDLAKPKGQAEGPREAKDEQASKQRERDRQFASDEAYALGRSATDAAENPYNPKNKTQHEAWERGRRDAESEAEDDAEPDEPGEVSTPSEQPSKADEYMRRIREAQLIKDTGAVRSEAAVDDTLNDEEFGRITRAVAAREEEIREAKGK